MRTTSELLKYIEDTSDLISSIKAWMVKYNTQLDDLWKVAEGIQVRDNAIVALVERVEKNNQDFIKCIEVLLVVRDLLDEKVEPCPIFGTIRIGRHRSGSGAQDLWNHQNRET